MSIDHCQNTIYTSWINLLKFHCCPVWWAQSLAKDIPLVVMSPWVAEMGVFLQISTDHYQNTMVHTLHAHWYDTVIWVRSTFWLISMRNSCSKSWIIFSNFNSSCWQNMLAAWAHSIGGDTVSMMSISKQKVAHCWFTISIAHPGRCMQQRTMLPYHSMQYEDNGFSHYWGITAEEKLETTGFGH